MPIDVDRQWASCEAAVKRRDKQRRDELYDSSVEVLIALGMDRKTAKQRATLAIDRGATSEQDVVRMST